jgi:hypothetical protein
MTKFKIGDRVRVLRSNTRRGETGTIIDLVPNIAYDHRPQLYVVGFDTANGGVSEPYFQFELYLPLRESSNGPPNRLSTTAT